MDREKRKPPLTSIIIPARDSWEMTEACLRSIGENTFSNYEIILVDDSSGAAAAAKMADAAGGRIRLLRNEESIGYSRSNNRAAGTARGDYLCLLNNDTLATPGWLAPMVEIMENSSGMGVLGNRHLFPGSGLLHHCGMAFNSEGHPQHLHPHSDPDAPAVAYQRELQIVTFACVLIPIAVYRELGGLSEDYRNGYEDCDFCLRAGEAGYSVAYTPASTIYHHGQATEGRTQLNKENWQLFRSRWSGRYRNDFDEITTLDNEHNRSVRRRPRLWRDGGEGVHFAVDFSEGSAFAWATADLIEALLEEGRAVSVEPSPVVHFGVAPAAARRLRRLMRKKPCRSYHLKWSHYWQNHMDQPLSGEVNAEFFCTNYIYPPGAGNLDPWMRHVRLNHYRKLPVSRFNREALEAAGVFPESCGVLPLGYAPQIDSLFPGGKAVGDVGGDLHLLVVTNSHDLFRYGTDLLVNALGRSFGPDDPVVIHLKDYGLGAASRRLEEWIADQPRFPRVVWHREFLDKGELIKLYSEMDLLVAPFRGEGFGMKILDAMALGLPVMMPAWGGPLEFAAEGTFFPLDHGTVEVGECFDRENFYLREGAHWCEADVGDLAEKLKALPDSRTELAERGALARAHVHGNYSWRAAARRLIRHLEGWRQERLVTVAPRRAPSRRDMTVIIPTKNREESLERALDGYSRQTLSRDRFEIVLVNDGGRREKVDALAREHSRNLSVRLLENDGPPGPAGARNRAVVEAEGEVLLFTGDDIVPEETLLDVHLKAHDNSRAAEEAFLGQTGWHEDVGKSPFLDYICGEGGHQFNYRGLRDGGEVPFDRFFTSNVSLKKSFLAEEEHLFSDRFRFAAYEDIDLAFRLHLRGMRMRYLEGAVARHLHPTDPVSFVERQKRVGRMLTVFTYVQPAYVPTEHKGFLQALEQARYHRQEEGFPDAAAGGADLLKGIIEAYTAMLAFLDRPGVAGGATVAVDEGDLRRWFDERGPMVWEGASELALRLGMAAEWAADEAEKKWAQDWITVVTLPSILRKADEVSGLNRGKELRKQAVRGGWAFSVALHYLARAVSWSRSTPLLGPLVWKMENSPMGRGLRRRMKGHREK